MRIGSRLSRDIVVNLAENGVPADAFINLLDSAQERLVRIFMDWGSDEAYLKMWAELESRGHVVAARAARARPGSARADGLQTVELDGQSETSVAWFEDPISGQPSSIEETIMAAISSGMRLEETPVIRDKLWKCVKGYLDQALRDLKMAIEVPMSATALVVPGMWRSSLQSVVAELTCVCR